MPRIVPSQVVEVIDRLFTPETLEHPNLLFTDGHESSFLTIMELVEQIPDELITVDADRYCAFLAALNSMRTAISRWQGGRCHLFKYVPGYDSSDLITLLRQVLVDCPDEFPSTDTAGMIFIEDQALRENLRLDISGTNRALSSGEWKAATVLAGSVVEALLLWALQQQPSEKLWKAVERLQKKDDPATKKPILGRKPDNDLKNWVLHDFIEVGLELGVVTADTAAQARLGKDFRNLIHPGRALRLEQVCDRGTALSAVAAVELVVRDLTP